MSPRGDQIAASPFGRLYRGQTAIDFYGKRKISVIVAILVVVVTLGSLFTRGLNLGLDFEGGQAWDVPATNSFDVDEAESILDDNGVSTTGSKIQRRSPQGSDADIIRIEIEVVPAETAATLSAEFAEAAGVETNEVTFSFTSASWGAAITEKAVRALAIFLAVVVVFISIRFEWRMAVASMVAMVHDVLLTVGVYTLFQFEVTPATVIAFLTILGYSLYDTIVVFDRVKENEGRFASVKMLYPDIVNISMNQVLMRSINTSISSVLPVLSILFVGSGLLGANALREFGVALLVGMIAGVYSSIFVASPLLARLKQRAGRSQRRHRLTGNELRAAVVGAGVSGRVVSNTSAEFEHETIGDGGSEADVDIEKNDAVHSSADRVLTHPPRPRKKKRR